MFKMAVEWLKHAKTAQEKEDTKTTVLNAEPAWKLLRQLLDERRRSIPALTDKDYLNGDWSALQAHRNGRIQEIDHLLQLLTFKER